MIFITLLFSLYTTFRILPEGGILAIELWASGQSLSFSFSEFKYNTQSSHQLFLDEISFDFANEMNIQISLFIK